MSLLRVLSKGMVGPANYMQLLVQRSRMEGFVIFDYAKDYPKAIADMAAWHKEGRLVFKEHIVDGLDQFPDQPFP